jgi:hypothetical protein
MKELPIHYTDVDIYISKYHAIEKKIKEILIELNNHFEQNNLKPSENRWSDNIDIKDLEKKFPSTEIRSIESNQKTKLHEKILEITVITSEENECGIYDIPAKFLYGFTKNDITDFYMAQV